MALCAGCDSPTPAKDIRGAACAPDGKTLVYWGQDSGYVTFEGAGEPSYLKGGAKWVSNVSFDASGKKVAVFSGDTRVYDVRSRKKQLDVSKYGNGLWFGSQFVLHDSENRVFQIHNAKDGKNEGFIQLRAGSIVESWLSHDGGAYLGSGQGVLVRWDGSNAKPPWVATPNGAVTAIAAHGKNVLVGTGSGRVIEYSPALEVVGVMLEEEGWVKALAVHPSGKSFAVGFKDRVSVHDWEGKELSKHTPQFEIGALTYCGGKLHILGVNGKTSVPQ